MVTSAQSRDAISENKRVHDFMVKGIRSVVYADEHGAERNPTIRLVDHRDLGPVATDAEHRHPVAVEGLGGEPADEPTLVVVGHGRHPAADVDRIGERVIEARCAH